ncbi:MAG: hypothetical protein ABIF12_00200 [bacterium]
MKFYTKKISSNPDFYYFPFSKKTKDIFLEINLKTGSAQETAQEAGLGHLLEHYLIGSLSKNKKSETLEYDGEVFKEQTNYCLKSSKKKILIDSDYFFNAILNPDFSNKKTFISEKDSVLNELSGKINSSDEQGYKIIFKERFLNDCQYARIKTEEYKNIKDKKIKDIEDYYKKYFIKSNILITLSGYNLDKKIINEISKSIKKYNISSGKIKFEQQNCQVSRFKIVSVKNNIIKKDIAVLLTFSFLGSKKLKPWQKIAQDAVCEMLSSSRMGIFDDLRNAGIYKLDYENFIWKNNGIIIFATILPKNKIKAFLNIFVKKIKEIKSGLILSKNLKKILSKYKNTAKKSFNDNSQRLDWLTYDIITYGKIIPIEEDLKNLKKINIVFIKNLANNLFAKNKLNLILIGKNLKNINKKEIDKILKF